MGLKLQEDKAVKPEAAAKAEVAEKGKEVIKAEAQVVEGAKEFGQMSEMIAFEACLGDPSKPDKTGDRVDPTIVGYRFKALADVEIPQVKPGANFKSDLMSFDEEDLRAGRTLKVKKGETFDLTKFETGLLMSAEGYNGRILGGKTPVTCTYTVNKVKDSAGKLISSAAATAVPPVSLRANSGTIKDAGFINVLTFTKTKNEKGTNTISRSIVKGFEKFEALCKEAVRTPRAGGSATAANAAEEHKTKRNDGALAFLQIVESKKKAPVQK